MYAFCSLFVDAQEKQTLLKMDFIYFSTDEVSLDTEVFHKPERNMEGLYL